LGLEIEVSSDRVTVCQSTYTKNILQKLGMNECKPVGLPMVQGNLTERSNVSKKVNFPYRETIGALMYLMLGSRPNLAYVIGLLSRNLESPTDDDVLRVKFVFRFLSAGVKKLCFKANFKPGVLEAFSDAGFGGCVQTGKSTTGVVST